MATGQSDGAGGPLGAVRRKLSLDSAVVMEVSQAHGVGGTRHD